MAQQYFFKFAEGIKSGEGTFPIRRRTIYDGSLASVSGSAGAGGVLRFYRDNGALTSVWTLGALEVAIPITTADPAQQFLLYQTGTTLCRPRVASHIYTDFTAKNKGLLSNLYIVDTNETGRVTATGTLTPIHQYVPVTPAEVKLSVVDGSGDWQYTAFRGSEYPLEAVLGSMINHEVTLWKPSVLFGAATVALTTGTTPSAVPATLTTTDAATVVVFNSVDYSAYAAVAGVSKYAIIFYDSAAGLAVWGYIGASTFSTNTTMWIYTTAADAVRSFNGDTTDKAITRTSITNCWIIPITSDVYVGQTAYKADDVTDNGKVNTMSSVGTGFLAFAAASTWATAPTSLWYSAYEKRALPNDNEGIPQTETEEMCLENGSAHTLKIAADTATMPVLGGHYTFPCTSKNGR